MSKFKELFPDRFYDVGIAEEHAATFAAGLAAGGLKPYCVIYSSFAQRAYDEIVHDVALQHLPVVFCFDRAGLVGEDGATHHGVFDLAAMRSIPNTVIAAPKDETEFKRMLWKGLEITEGPYIIRYPRGMGEGTSWKTDPVDPIDIGKCEKLMDGEEVAVLALGPVANRAFEAASRLKEESGKTPALYNVRFLKPLDPQMLSEISRFRQVITLEDGSLRGGLYSEVCEYAASNGLDVAVKGFGTPDRFIGQGTVDSQREECGLDADSIFKTLDGLFKNN